VLRIVLESGNGIFNVLHGNPLNSLSTPSLGLESESRTLDRDLTGLLLTLLVDVLFRLARRNRGVIDLDGIVEHILPGSVLVVLEKAHITSTGVAFALGLPKWLVGLACRFVASQGLSPLHEVITHRLT